MSGHSKWHSIRHKKAIVDAKRGKAFTRLLKEVTMTARIGGGDQHFNPRLRLAVEKAKAGNVPRDNIDRAIKKGTGDLPGVRIEDASYEGYAAGGVAVFVQAATDNRNRTVSDVRHLFSKYGGNLGENGSVNWMFEKAGQFLVPKDQASEDDLIDLVLTNGGSDVLEDGGHWDLRCPPEAFAAVRDALGSSGIQCDSEEMAMLATQHVRVAGGEAQRVLKLMEALEDHEDVIGVWANFDMDDEELDVAAS